MPDWPTKLRTIQLEPAAAPAPSAAANDDERPAYESPFFVKKLEDLRHELIDEEQEAGAVTFYGTAMLFSIALPRSRWYSRACWILGAVMLACTEMFALQAVAMGSIWPKCVYDDDCPLGKVCLLLQYVGREEFQKQGVCTDCSLFSGDVEKEGGWTGAIRSIIGLGELANFRFTKSRTDDRWPAVTNAFEYCYNQIIDPAVSEWVSGPSDDGEGRTSHIGECLHIKESMKKFGALDFIVMIIAFFLVCASISHERQQQLYCRYLRQTLLPPPYRDLRAACLQLVELLTAALLPCVTLSMSLLIFSGNMASTDMLLNGVAIAFVLVIDDELPNVILSQTDVKAIEHFAEGVGDKQTMSTLKLKGLATALVSFIALFINLSFGQYLPCDTVAYGCFLVAFVSPVASRLLEELVAVQYTLEMHAATMAAKAQARAAAEAQQAAAPEGTKLKRRVTHADLMSQVKAAKSAAKALKAANSSKGCGSPSKATSAAKCKTTAIAATAAVAFADAVNTKAKRAPVAPAAAAQQRVAGSAGTELPSGLPPTTRSSARSSAWKTAGLAAGCSVPAAATSAPPATNAGDLAAAAKALRWAAKAKAAAAVLSAQQNEEEDNNGTPSAPPSPAESESGEWREVEDTSSTPPPSPAPPPAADSPSLTKSVSEGVEVMRATFRFRCCAAQLGNALFEGLGAMICIALMSRLSVFVYLLDGPLI